MLGANTLCAAGVGGGVLDGMINYHCGQRFCEFPWKYVYVCNYSCLSPCTKIMPPTKVKDDPIARKNTEPRIFKSQNPATNHGTSTKKCRTHKRTRSPSTAVVLADTPPQRIAPPFGVALKPTGLAKADERRPIAPATFPVAKVVFLCVCSNGD